MDFITDQLQLLNQLRPIDLSVTMFAFTVFDLWTALSLTFKNKSLISKRLFTGYATNMLVILLPFVLRVLAMAPAIADGYPHNVDYIHLLSVGIAVMYIASTLSSILANYSAAYPESKNWLTKLTYKLLPAEVVEKQEKHGITLDALDKLLQAEIVEKQEKHGITLDALEIKPATVSESITQAPQEQHAEATTETDTYLALHEPAKQESTPEAVAGE